MAGRCGFKGLRQRIPPSGDESNNIETKRMAKRKFSSQKVGSILESLLLNNKNEQIRVCLDRGTNKINNKNTVKLNWVK